MAAMHGDPTQELAYLEWKKSMSRVANANPYSESRTLPNGAVIANQTIFRLLKDNNYGLDRLEILIPKKEDDWASLGTLFGDYIGIDYYGRFQFGEHPGYLTEDEVMPICQHGYVVRSREGDYKYLCKECDEKFVRHPAALPEPVVFNVPDGVTPGIVNELQKFREGAITLSKAALSTGIALKDFKDVLEGTFPPLKFTMELPNMTIPGGPAQGSIEVGDMPTRTSCPRQIEEVFGNIDVNLTDLIKITETVFKDITKVNHCQEQETRKMIVMIRFVDDTKQRVEIDMQDWRDGSRLFKNTIEHTFSPHTGAVGWTQSMEER